MPPAASPSGGTEDYLGRLRREGSSAGTPQAPSIGPDPSPVDRPARATGPSDFTRVVSGHRSTPSSAAAAPTPPPPGESAPTRPASRRPMILGLGAVFVAALLVLAAFAVWARMGPAPSEAPAEEVPAAETESPPAGAEG